MNIDVRPLLLAPLPTWFSQAVHWNNGLFNSYDTFRGAMFEILGVVTMKTAVFWDLMLCTSVNRFRAEECYHKNGGSMLLRRL
jgi:hypothetical protein